MVLAGSHIIEPVIVDRHSDAEERQDKLKQALDFPVISDWKDYVFPIEYFADTNYHLNNKGREMRTLQLIEDIRLWLGEDSFIMQ